MQNQFSVQPLGGLNVGESFGQAVQQIEERGIRNQQQADKQELQGFMQKAYSGDPDAMREVFVRNPNLGMELKKMDDDRLAKFGAAKKQAADAANFEYSKGIKFAKTPEEKAEIIQRAIEDPASDLYDQEDIGKDASELDFDANMLLYTRLGDKGFKAMGFGADESKSKSLTPKQKDFAMYQELQKTDKEAAEVFGAGAGFVKDDKQRVFQIIDGIKVFADGTEKPLGDNDKIKTSDMKAAISRSQALNVVGKAKEYQTKNVGFAMRLRDSIDQMTALEKGLGGDKVDPARAALINKALGDGTVSNMSLSSGEQQYIINAKDALFAILRPETGAAITDSEMAQYGKIYLPQPGDSKGTTKLKKRKMENQFRALRDKAPRIYDATKVIQQVDKPKEDLSDEALLQKYGG